MRSVREAAKPLVIVRPAQPERDSAQVERQHLIVDRPARSASAIRVAKPREGALVIAGESLSQALCDGQSVAWPFALTLKPILENPEAADMAGLVVRASIVVVVLDQLLINIGTLGFFAYYRAVLQAPVFEVD